MEKSSVRHSEKLRKSSCLFADLVARLAIAELERRTPLEPGKHQQTVLAAIALRHERANEETAVRIVAFGLGTKFMPRNLVEDAGHAELVLDCHAEVLAKRSFTRFLLQQMICCAYIDDRDQRDCIFEQHAGPVAAFSLKEGVTFHLYSSAQPCGNATIKKWAKGGVGRQFLDLSKWDYPIEGHPPFSCTARAEGQVGLLAKRDTPASANSKLQEQEGVRVRKMAGEEPEPPPNGMATVSSGEGVLMSCSDKIAKWNALGVQSGLCICFLRGPIFLASCTIGHKFSLKHCQRALCCRLKDFKQAKYPDLPPQYSTHHPSMLTTCVKFDTGVYEGDEGANFSERRLVIGVQCYMLPRRA
jgi:hypothetical protein